MINKTHIIIASLLVLVAAIPATLLLSQKPQDTRSKASASTTLYYTPSTTQTTPLQKNTGESVSLDVMVNPGTNLPSIIKLDMLYDQTKFSVGTAPFVVNTTAFPSTIEGPVLLNGEVLISVSIGNDSTRAVNKVTKIGTLTLTATTPTTGNVPAVVSFGTRSQILSIAASDQSTENVLASTQPALVSIAGTTTLPTVVPTLLAAATATIVPSPTALPSATSIPTVLPTATHIPTVPPTATTTPIIGITTAVTPTSVPTLTPIPTVTLSPLATALTFDLGLHGIGTSGDNANPTANDFSTKAPLHPSRTVVVTLYDDQNHLVTTQNSLIAYSPATGTFTGTVDLGNSVQVGDYTVRIKEDTHLRRLIPGIQHILPQKINKMPAVAVIAGDINGDNVLNILDYNLIVGCYSDLLPAADCDAGRKAKSDLNDNGDVNQFDYNLFLREITVQAGN